MAAKSSLIMMSTSWIKANYLNMNVFLKLFSIITPASRSFFVLFIFSLVNKILAKTVQVHSYIAQLDYEL